MKLPRKDALKLVNSVGPRLFTDNAVRILEKLIKGTFHKTIDDAHREATIGFTPVLKCVHIQERQVMRILQEQLHDVLQFERKAKKITYTLNLESLIAFEADAEKQFQAASKKVKENRTANARKKRAENRSRLNGELAAAIAIARFILIPDAKHVPAPTPKADPAYVKTVFDKARAAEGLEPWLPKPDYVRVCEAGQLAA
jgi:hypothetical protein